ncbi:hypothetical protein [Microbulbifer sp. ZKSA002]|uniref:hypothetical protein n=1 Tax=Microbulbifer sp. ZKSA002 TaxID=3243388 RepID=UPI00403A0581
MEEVAGVKIIEALGALRFLSAGGLNLSALDNLNITTASDINISAGRDLKEQIGNIRESVAKVRQTIKVKDGGKVWLGNDTDNVLGLLSDLMGIVIAMADDLANHKHEGVSTGAGKSGKPESADTYSSASTETSEIKGKLESIKQ